MVRLREHIGTITWAVATRLLFVGYGFVMLLQIAVVPPHEYGLFALLVTVQTWIFILSDSSALLGLVQFGAEPEEQPRVNLLIGLLHAGVAMGLATCFWALRFPLAQLFREPQLVQVATLLVPFCAVSVPRTFCAKLLYRELAMRQVFWLDLSWVGTMALLTVWLLWQRQLRGFEELATVAVVGMGVSSVVGLWLCRSWLRFGWHGRTRLRDILRFTLPQALASALHTGMRQLDVYVVQYFFGVAVVGVYQTAKTFNRVFDTVFDLVAGLLHPAAVRLLSVGAEEGLRTLLAKTLSVTFLSIAAVVVLIEVGVADLLLTPLLVTEYEPAIAYFKLFALGALGVPFAVLGPAILAVGRSGRMLGHIAVATLLGMAVFGIVGHFSAASLAPLGFVAYTATLGLLNFWFIRRRFRISWRELFRGVADLKGFVQSLRSQQV
ncbi:MAG: oligosaccharide flippase family protein [Chlorobiota bacterium]